MLDGRGGAPSQTRSADTATSRSPGARYNGNILPWTGSIGNIKVELLSVSRLLVDAHATMQTFGGPMTGPQVDLFLDQLVDASIKDEQRLMEFPFFALQKQP